MRRAAGRGLRKRNCAAGWAAQGRTRPAPLSITDPTTALPCPALPCPAAALLLLADISIPQLQCHCGGLAVTRTRHSFILGRPFRRLTGKKLLASTRSSPPPVNNNGNLSDQPEPEPTNLPTCPISAGHPCHLGVSGESGFVSQGRDRRRRLLQWKSAAIV